ncbi:hypothetical protein [Micromonospora sp. NPDC049102]|uniref:hypothetical protein n=1 Tax=Micromonospora sp. NPDC049102 TaxID=3364265 RepID=UPI00371D5531
MTDVLTQDCPEFLITWVRSGVYVHPERAPAPAEVHLAEPVPGLLLVHSATRIAESTLARNALLKQPLGVIARMADRPPASVTAQLDLPGAVARANALRLPVCVPGDTFADLDDDRVLPIDHQGRPAHRAEAAHLLVLPEKHLVAEHSAEGRDPDLARVVGDTTPVHLRWVNERVELGLPRPIVEARFSGLTLTTTALDDERALRNGILGLWTELADLATGQALRVRTTTAGSDVVDDLLAIQTPDGVALLRDTPTGAQAATLPRVSTTLSLTPVTVTVTPAEPAARDKAHRAQAWLPARRDDGAGNDDVRGGTLSVVQADDLPVTATARYLPRTSRDAFVVTGRNRLEGGVEVAGHDVTAEGLADWVTNQPGFAMLAADAPVVLLFAEAGPYASVVAQRLNRTVIGAWGTFARQPSGSVTAGLVMSAPPGPVLVRTASDTWNRYTPDGGFTALGRDLEPVLEEIGVRLTPAAQSAPAEVWGWGVGHGVGLNELDDTADLEVQPLTATSASVSSDPEVITPAPAEERRPVYSLNELEQRRPVRLVETTPSTPEPDVRWADGARLPSYFFDPQLGLGHSDIVLRGHAEVLQGIRRSMSAVGDEHRDAVRPGGPRPSQPAPPFDVPQATWDEITTALAEEPASFLGDGRPFIVHGPDGTPSEIIIRARPRGNWDRFRDADGAAYRVENQTLRTADLRADKSTGDARRIAVSVPLGSAPAPGAGFGQVGLEVIGNERTYAYGFGSSSVDQRETRISFPASVAGRGVSHVHVDGVDFTVNAYQQRAQKRTLVREARFSVQGGLQARVPDLVTKPTELTVPKHIEIDGRVPDDAYTVEQGSSAGGVFEAALRLFPEATIGSPAYSVLRQTFSTRGLTGSFSDAVDGVGVLQEVTSGGNAAPLGAIRVSARLGRATLLVTTDGQEIRAGRAAGVRAEMGMSATSGVQVSGIGGASSSVATRVVKARIQAGLTGSASWSWRETALSGGTASRKRLAVSWGRNATYEVAVDFTLERTGGRSTTVQSRVVLRLSEEEAKRLGDPPGSAPAPAPAKVEPTAPPYLAVDQPGTLGLHNVRSLTGVTELRHRAIESLSKRYPDLVAPWRELDPQQPRWVGRRDAYTVVLRNTIQLSRFLSVGAMTGATDTLISTGQRLRLAEYHTFRKRYVTLKLSARLTGRRYVGSEEGVGMRVFSSLSDRIDSVRRVVRGASAGGTTNGRAQAKTGLGVAISTTWRRFWQWTSTTGFGQAVFGEDQVIAPEGSDSFAYDVEYDLSEVSFTRPRNAWRVLTLGVLAAEPFVQRSDWRPVLTDTEHPATGTLTIRVPDALTSAVQGPVPAPTRPDAGRRGTAMDSRDWRERVHVVVGVTGAQDLHDKVTGQLANAQQHSWLYTQPGTAVHEIVQNGLTPDAINANFLRMATTGWRLAPLVAKRPVQDRVGALSIHAHVSNLRAASGLFSDEMELDIDRQGEARVSQVVGRSTGHGLNLSAQVLATPKVDHTSVPGGYGPNWAVYERLHARDVATWMTGVHEVDPVFNGRFVLVTGDVTYNVQAQGRRTGKLALKRWVTVRRTTPGRLKVHEGVWMVMREDDAEELGLIPAAPGGKPDYGSVTVPREFRANPIGWSPENVPDTRRAVSEMRRWFAAQPEGRYKDLLPIDELEDLNSNLRHLQSATSTLGMSALLGQMVAGGLPVRLLGGTSYLPWTKRARLWIGVELGRPRFLEARFSHEIDEYPNSQAGAQNVQSVIRTRGGGVSVGEGTSLGDSHADASAGFSDTGYRTTTDTHAEAKRSVNFRNTATNVNRPTAKLAFPTKVILSLEERGTITHTVAGDGGVLVAGVPWSLTVPAAQPDGAMGAPLQALRPDAPELGKPLDLPRNALIMEIGDIPGIRRAGAASIASQEGAPSDQTGRTPLTQGGNVAAEVLVNSLSGGMLRAFFPQFARPEGHQLPQLSENHLFGGATADATVRAQVDLGGGVLVSVSDDHRYDLAQRVGRNVAIGGSRTDAHGTAFSAGPALNSGNPQSPAFTSGANPNERAWGETQADGMSAVLDTSQRALVKPMYRRSFVFRFPVAWQFTTTGTRPAWRGAHRALRGNGAAPRGPGDHLVERGVWIRLMEAEARALGLITDELFPPEAAKEWNAVANARKDWFRADQTFRDLRDSLGTANAALAHTREALYQAETDAAQHPQGVPDTPTPAIAQEGLGRASQVAAAAEREMTAARVAAEQQARRYAELRASATAITTWYRTPAAKRTGPPPRSRVGNIEATKAEPLDVPTWSLRLPHTVSAYSHVHVVSSNTRSEPRDLVDQLIEAADAEHPIILLGVATINHAPHPADVGTLNYLLEQFAQRAILPTVVTRGRLTRELSEVTSRYGATVVHPTLSKALDGTGLRSLQTGHRWAASVALPPDREATANTLGDSRPTGAAGETWTTSDDIWDRITAGVLDAAGRMARPTGAISRVGNALGELVWAADLTTAREVLREHGWTPEETTANLAQVEQMIKRVPGQSALSVYSPVLRFAAAGHSDLVFDYTLAQPEHRPTTLLASIGRLEAAGQFSNVPVESGITPDDLVEMIDLAGVEEDDRFTTSIVTTLGLIKKREFPSAMDFIVKNRGTFDVGHKGAWVDAIRGLQSIMPDHNAQLRLLVYAVLEC